MGTKRGTRYVHVTVLFLLVILLSIGSPFASMAQDSRAAATTTGEAFTVPADVVAYRDEFVSQTVVLQDGRMLAMVELLDAPAGVVYAQAGGESAAEAARSLADAQRRVVAEAQSAFINAAAAAGVRAEVLSSTDTVLNSVTVAVAPEEFATLIRIAGVRAVYPVGVVQRDTSSAVPHVGAPSAWNGSLGGSYTGLGTVISIIDSGIDYSHRNMGGDGSWSINPADRVTLADAEPNFGTPADKVIGGWDYVGDAFNAGNPETSGLPAVTTQSPDPDPMDCTIRPADLIPTFGVAPTQSASGHGSHVAGIAAGIGVDGAGATYAGGYLAVPFSTLRIGPGVAPEAKLLAMRVFGCYGSAFVSTIVEAIDDSVSGAHSGGVQADVINMSLGSPFGNGSDDSTLTPYIAAIENAMLSGTLVVTSAGNNYDTTYTTGSPGVTGWALSVAATDDGGTGALLVNQAVTIAAGTYLPAQNGAAPSPNPYPVTGNLVEGFDVDEDGAGTVATTTDGCSAYTNAAAVAGNIVLVNRGNCTFQIKHNVAAAAGAIGVVIGNNAAAPGAPIIPGGTFTIPVLMVSTGDGFAAGSTLRAAIAAGAVNVTMNPYFSAVFSPVVDTIATFSSRGPRGNDVDGGIKPDIAAPGAAIVTTGSGTGNDIQTLGGTSMASPMVAGAAAVVMSHPTYASWTPAQVKALLMNTANNDIRLGTTAGPRLGPQRMGSGSLDVVDALSNSVIAYNILSPYLVGVSFGEAAVLPGTGPNTFTREVQFRNRGATAATYNLSIDTYTNNNVAAYTVSPSSVTVPAFGSVTVTVTLTVDIPLSGTAPHNNADASLATSQATTIGTFARHYLSEEGAILKAVPTAGATVSLRVPLYASIRAASEMYAATNPVTIFNNPVGTTTVPLTGVEVFTGASGFPGNIVSTVSAFQLTGVDDTHETGVNLHGLDIQYVGVSSNFNNGGNTAGSTNGSTVLTVGLSTVEDWATPNELFFNVYFDTAQNGFTSGPDDFTLFSTAPNITGTTSRSDVFLTALGLTSLGSGFFHDFLNGTSASFDTYVFDTNVMALNIFPGLALNYDNNGATPASPMLGAGDTDFNFYVETFSRNPLGAAVDVSPIMYFDLASPAIDPHVGIASGFPALYDDVNGNWINVAYDLTVPTGDVPAALLLLHHHNRRDVVNALPENFNRAEVIYFNASLPTPTATDTPTPTDTPTDTPTATATDTATATPPPPCIIVSRTNITVTEGGSSAVYNVRLSASPAVGETVTVFPQYDNTQLLVTPASRQLNSTNWNTGRNFTVTAVDDLVAEFPLNTPLNHTATSSLIGSIFNGIVQCSTITVHVADNDGSPATFTPTNTATATDTATPTDTATDTPTATATDTPVDTPTPTDTATDTATPTNTPTSTPVLAGIIVSTSHFNLIEGGSGYTFNVKLQYAPAPGESVTIFAITSDGTQFTLSPTSRQLNLSNWNTGRNFTATAVDDLVTDGLYNGTVTFTVTSNLMTSPYFGFIPSNVVTVAVADND